MPEVADKSIAREATGLMDTKKVSLFIDSRPRIILLISLTLELFYQSITTSMVIFFMKLALTLCFFPCISSFDSGNV